MIKTIYYCDFCNTESSLEFQKIQNYHVCLTCIHECVDRAIKHGELKPYCHNCENTGQIHHSYYNGVDRDHWSEPCPECTI